MTDFDDRCRVCLQIFSKASVRIDLLDKHSRLSNEFVACCGISEGNHPRYLCANCSDKTTRFYQFKQRYVKSRQTFGEMVLSKIPAHIIVQHHYVSDNNVAMPVENDKDAECPDDLLSLPKTVNSDINANVPTEEEELPEELLGFDETTECQQQIDVFEQVDQGGGAKSTYLPQSSSDSEDSLSPDDLDMIETTTSTTHDGSSLLVRRKMPSDLKVLHRVTNRKAHTKFSCEICSKVCYKKRTFNAHMRTHQGLAPYQCDRVGCDITFKTEASLRKHTNRHENSARFVCQEKDCGRSYARSDTLHRHMWNEHCHGKPPPGHVCELCGKVMSNKTILQIHRFTHKDKSELPLACDYPNCVRRFLFSGQLEDHKRIHTSPFKCPHCNVTKATQNMLNKHINLHTKEQKYPCEKCDKVFYSDTQMKMHNQKVHQRERIFPCRICSSLQSSLQSRNYHEQKMHKSFFKCPHCDATKATQNMLNKHINLHTKETKYPCKVCNKIFYSDSQMKIHNQKVHQRDRIYPCRFCSSLQRSLQSRKSHEQKMHGSLFKCPHCDATKVTQDLLDKHINLHTKETEYPCKVCDKIFYSDSQMKSHTRKVHQRDRIHRSTDTRTYHEQKMHKSIFKCPHCDATKVTQDLLDKHINLHTKEKKYPCEMCDKIYYTDAARKSHNWKWHRQDPPSFKCPHCEASKTTQHLLNLHINLHTKDKEYPCEICDKIFYSDAQRKTHNWKVHQEHRSYPCRFCSFICKTASIRLLHEQRHDGTKPRKVRKKPHCGPKIHECQECDKKYQHATSLRSHMMKSHTEATESSESVSNTATLQSGASVELIDFKDCFIVKDILSE